ncbi:DUF2987 domain-containing protein [Vibrio hippocampi]|uniref:DUF2987 domain-containing protein n=1 Tax=Vibrio hippocampi TaxID=654686 RepID=A0ABM8ZID1_9VIBR|nr:DUF2987 domain-containing protein [Vibrio hippocampi]CAH0525977.1 hypothetical protein VHP8226_01459 [Vibrio hippocampi]
MKFVAPALLACLAVSSISMPLQAEEYRFTYSKLFTQLKNNNKPGHDAVKVGLFFVDARTQKPCVITKAWMEKEQHYEELSSGYANELLVPIDNNLRQANPLVFIHTPEQQQCDFSMVVMSKQPLEGSVSYEDVAQLLPQMEAMLADLGGLFSGWFTPEITGLTLEFAPDQQGDIQLSDGRRIAIEAGKAVIQLEDIGVGNSFQLPNKTLRVMPYIAK